MNKPVREGEYEFSLSLDQDAGGEIFILNIKIRQDDNKEDHLIKFRLGIGKDKKSDSKTHQTHVPHFEIDIYRRNEESFSATVYFTFADASDAQLMEYCKGTIVVISRILSQFVNKHEIDVSVISKLIYESTIERELSQFEPKLIEALYECYKRSDLVVRQDGEVNIIKTEHNLTKYLDGEDLKPLYLPLMTRIREENT